MSRWNWPLRRRVDIPQAAHPGAFGALRKYDRHTGVDLYCNVGSEVFAVEDGVVVAVEDFTGAKAASPWWFDTRSVLIEGDSGVVLYGEIREYPELVPGVTVHRGTIVGLVQRVLRHDKGRPTSMLHIELYYHGTKASTGWGRDQLQPKELLDPTPFLLAAEEASGSLWPKDLLLCPHCKQDVGSGHHVAGGLIWCEATGQSTRVGRGQ